MAGADCYLACEANYTNSIFWLVTLTLQPGRLPSGCEESLECFMLFSPVSNTITFLWFNKNLICVCFLNGFVSIW